MHMPTVSWRSKVLNHRWKDFCFFFFFFFFFHIYFSMILAGISIGKLLICMLGESSCSIRQFDWLGFLSIACELCTKLGTVRDPSECADASKVATRVSQTVAVVSMVALKYTQRNMPCSHPTTTILPYPISPTFIPTLA